MALVRFGSCGAVQPDIAVGTVCVCEQGCTLITQNPDAYGHDAPEGELKFRFDLQQLLLKVARLSNSACATISFLVQYKIMPISWHSCVV
jgi:uridine phosphorylase